MIGDLTQKGNSYEKVSIIYSRDIFGIVGSNAGAAIGGSEKGLVHDGIDARDDEGKAEW